MNGQGPPMDFLPGSGADLSGMPHIPDMRLTSPTASTATSSAVSAQSTAATTPVRVASGKKKASRNASTSMQKRRCISTACVACRKRKSKCDGAFPSCAACASVYYTECVYDPNSDHRRKGVYRGKVDSMKAQNSTLQILIEAILNAAEEDVGTIVRQIRTCDSLDAVAEAIMKEELSEQQVDNDDLGFISSAAEPSGMGMDQPVEGERELARKMGELRLENGSVRFIGGTSHLIYVDGSSGEDGMRSQSMGYGGGVGGLADAGPGCFKGGAGGGQVLSQFEPPYTTGEEAINSWTTVTNDTLLILHLMNMYFNWHYTYFTTLSKSLFYRDFLRGRPQTLPSCTVYCSSLLVNAMLSLGCHFTSVSGAFAVAGDSRTKGDHFFAEAKRLIVDNDEYEKPRLATVQALALMSVREAGCAREAKGWVYSGMSFRMAQDIGLNLDSGEGLNEGEIDARRITFWGCFLFDKAWSNYMGRLPQLPKNSYNVPKYDVFPEEDAEMWSPFTDAGFNLSQRQPSRTRAAGLQLSKLCEISSDLLLFFYHPNHIGRSSGKAVELKKLSEIQRRLEDWRRELPKELEPKEGQLPNVLLTHMFFHLQYIHLFRPFLKYSPATSPLPAHISPRRICTANASTISKLMRLYKKKYNLRQICNIAVYMIHSACTIHLLNLPEKTAKRDIIHGVKHLEEMAEDWLCARRTLCIISVLARKWGVQLPEEASAVLSRSDEKYGTYSTADVPSPHRGIPGSMVSASPQSNAASPQTATSAEYSAATQPMETGNSNLDPYSRAPVQQQQATYGQLAQALSFAPDLSATRLAPEYLGGMPRVSRAASGVETLPKASVVALSMGSYSDITEPAISISDALPSLGSWTMPGAVSQSVAGYGQRQLAQPLPGPSGGAQQMTSAMLGLDDEAWLLKDCANWQHHFETWGPGQQQQPQGRQPQQPQRPPQAQQQQQQQQTSQPQHVPQGTASPSNTGNAGTPLSDNSVFMFRGSQGGDLDMSFDDLGGADGNLDGLGLE